MLCLVACLCRISLCRDQNSMHGGVHNTFRSLLNASSSEEFALLMTLCDPLSKKVVKCCVREKFPMD